MAASDEDRDRSRRLGVEDWGRSSTCRVLDGRTIERLGDVVYGLHHVQGDEKREFLDLGSKPRTTVSSSLALKPVAMVLVFLPQNHSLRFLGFSLKISSYGLVI
jgi:hypothetical protein